MPSYTDQDFRRGIDIILQAGVTAAQLVQLIENAQPATLRGMILWGNVPDHYPAGGPNVSGYPRLARYLWLDTTSGVILKKWNGTAWVSVITDIADDSVDTAALVDAAVTAIKIAAEAITTEKLAAGAVTPEKTDFTSEEEPLSVFDIIIARPTIDPRFYGADNDGVTDSTVAIRKAIFQAAAINGIVKFPAGIYKLNIDIAYDETDESVPYLFGTDYCYRDKFNPLLPLLDGSIITSDGGAILKLAVDQTGSRYIFSSLGRENIIIENLTIDGNLANQPNRGAAYSKYGGLGDIAINAGNKAVIRYNTIQNFVGSRVIHSGPFGDPSAIVTPYSPQIDFSLGEPFGIIFCSDCQIHDNIIKKHWGGGLAPSGRGSKIYNNVIEDVAGQGISFFIWQCANAGYEADGGALSENHIIYHSLMGYLDVYKGVKLGTNAALNNGYFYGQGESDTVMRAHWTNGSYNNYDKSVWSYYTCFNECYNNTFRRVGSVSINIEHSLCNSIRGNRIEQGIPLITYPSLPFTPNPLSGTLLKATGYLGISEAAHSGDNSIENNEIVVLPGDLGKIQVSAIQKNEFSTIQSQGFAWPLGGYLDDPAAFDQSYILNKRIRGNIIINKLDSDDLVRPTRILDLLGATGNWGANYPIQISSTDSDDGGSVQDAEDFRDTVTEMEIDFGNYPSMLPVAACLVGNFNIENTSALVATDQLSYEYFAMLASGGAVGTPSIYQGTQQRNHRLFILRRDALWQLEYEFSLSKRDDEDFRIYQKGKILFKYDASSILTFDHDVESLDYTSGVFEITAAYDQLLVNNIMTRQLQNREFPSIYRGGIRVLVNPFDYSLYGFTDSGGWNINNQLVFNSSGNIKQL